MASNKPIKLLIVDDEQLIRSGLAILLNTYEDIEVAGEADNGQAAFEFCQHNPVDVVLMDIRMPDSNGIEGTKLIKTAFPAIKVLILTTFKDTEYISSAMNNGASGYLLKDSSHEDIHEGIRTAYRGNLVLDGKLNIQLGSTDTNELAQDFDGEKYSLNDKEIQIIQLVASGYSNQEIADELFLSLGTIKNNMSLILDKLELRDRTQLAIFAYEHGLK